MKLLFGPTLLFRGADNDQWRVSALVITEGKPLPSLEWWTRSLDSTVLIPELLWQREDEVSVWRFDVVVTRTSSAQRVNYEVCGVSGFFLVPALGEPLRLAYASCNGFSDLKVLNKNKQPYERWSHLGKTHRERGFHVMLMGGDQVYSDSFFDVVPELDQWQHLPRSKKVRAPFTPTMAASVDEYFFNHIYAERWSQPEVALMLGQVPTLMMWDDHDIFDGWGSYDPDLQECPVYQGLWEIARRHFLLFQHHCAPQSTPPATIAGQVGLSWFQRIDDVAIVAPDLRSERSQMQVASLETWDAIYGLIDGLKGCRHLLVMSSIPVVYATVQLVEKILDLVPGDQELEDDLKDQWRSRAHLDERKRLVHRLLKFATEKQCRVTLLSGDVHVPAVGVIESERSEHAATNARIIHQLVSSGIAHPPPPLIAVSVLDRVLGGGVEEIDRGITARMNDFPNTSRRLVPKRNWLSLEFDEQARLWANWWLEGEQHPYTKVIHPVVGDGVPFIAD